MGSARVWLLAGAILTAPVWVAAQQAPPPVIRMPAVKIPPSQIPSASPLQSQALKKTQQFDTLRRQREQADAAAKRGAQQERNAQRTADERRSEQRRLALGLTHKFGQGDDCDDTRVEIHRLAAETCDNHDNNCDGVVDEGQKLAFFLDADGDGHGDPRQRIDACPIDQQRAASEGRWLVPVGNDCNDANSEQWQGCP